MGNGLEPFGRLSPLIILSLCIVISADIANRLKSIITTWKPTNIFDIETRGLTRGPILELLDLILPAAIYSAPHDTLFDFLCLQEHVLVVDMMGLSFRAIHRMIVRLDTPFDLLVEQVSLSSTDLVTPIYSGCGSFVCSPFHLISFLSVYLLCTPQVPSGILCGLVFL